MADNYLENKMDDLRSGRLGRKVATAKSHAPAPGYLRIPFPSRRVLVTGGANGIGLAIVRAFLKANCKVAVFDIDKQAGEKLAYGEGVRFSHVDISDVTQLESAFSGMIKAWRDVDIIVNNAGISLFKPLIEGNLEYFDKVIDTNLRPIYVLARLWALHKKQIPIPSEYGGRMINISSTRHIQSEVGTEGYTASKGAVAALTHALMMSLSEFNITVNSISPGWIHTGDPSQLTESDHKQHPSNRVGKPEDIARACIFLALPDNNFINGADLIIDGGMTRKMIYMP